ncbi:MAG: hypothetical protein Devi2KO_36180 [Devosia indica]
MNTETIDAQIYLGRVFALTQLNLGLRGVGCDAVRDGIKCTHADDTLVIGDLGAMTGAFFDLGTDYNDVGDALAAHVLDHFGVKHQLKNRGVTIAICGRA